MLHASGKYVSSILSFLQPHLNAEQSQILKEYHDFVLKHLTSTDPDSEQHQAVVGELSEKLANIKKIARTYKKPGATNVE